MPDSVPALACVYAQNLENALLFKDASEHRARLHAKSYSIENAIGCHNDEHCKVFIVDDDNVQ